MNNGNTSAFPHALTVGDISKSTGGLTKREYLAGRALQGLLSCQPHARKDEVLREAVRWADGLISELNEPQAK